MDGGFRCIQRRCGRLVCIASIALGRAARGDAGNRCKRVDSGGGDRVTVLDISLKTNLDTVQRVLGKGAVIEYFDHHLADAS